MPITTAAEIEVQAIQKTEAKYTHEEDISANHHHSNQQDYH